MTRPVPLPPVHATGATQAGLPVVHVEGEGLFTVHQPVVALSGWCSGVTTRCADCRYASCNHSCHKAAS